MSITITITITTIATTIIVVTIYVLGGAFLLLFARTGAARGLPEPSLSLSDVLSVLWLSLAFFLTLS